ncbi:hypothetical protein Tco_0934490 [Tanacetum coccineum]
MKEQRSAPIPDYTFSSAQYEWWGYRRRGDRHAGGESAQETLEYLERQTHVDGVIKTAVCQNTILLYSCGECGMRSHADEGSEIGDKTLHTEGAQSDDETGGSGVLDCFVWDLLTCGGYSHEASSVDWNRAHSSDCVELEDGSMSVRWDDVLGELVFWETWELALAGFPSSL